MNCFVRLWVCYFFCLLSYNGVCNVDFDFKGKWVLVIGFGVGIGKVIVKIFVQEGVLVVVNGLMEQEVDMCVEDLCLFGDVIGLVVDLIKIVDVECLFVFVSEV